MTLERPELRETDGIDQPPDLHLVRGLVRGVLDAMDFKGRDALLHQIPAITGTSGLVTMLELIVDTSAVAPADFGSGPTPGGAWALTSDGQPIGHLSVWVSGGYLERLELGWVTDERPITLPPVESLRFDLG